MAQLDPILDDRALGAHWLLPTNNPNEAGAGIHLQPTGTFVVFRNGMDGMNFHLCFTFQQRVHFARLMRNETGVDIPNGTTFYPKLYDLILHLCSEADPAFPCLLISPSTKKLTKDQEKQFKKEQKELEKLQKEAKKKGALGGISQPGAQWGINDVSQWLEAIELKEYAGAFKKNKVDGVTLLKLGEDDLKEMGVGVLGHRKKILEGLAILNMRLRGPPPGMVPPGMMPPGMRPGMMPPGMMPPGMRPGMPPGAGGPRPAPMATIGLVARNVNGQVKVFDTDTGEEITDIVAHQKLKREQLAAKEAAENPNAQAEDAVTPVTDPAAPPLPAPIKTLKNDLEDDYDNTDPNEDSTDDAVVTSRPFLPPPTSSQPPPRPSRSIESFGGEENTDFDRPPAPLPMGAVKSFTNDDDEPASPPPRPSYGGSHSESPPPRPPPTLPTQQRDESPPPRPPLSLPSHPRDSSPPPRPPMGRGGSDLGDLPPILPGRPSDGRPVPMSARVDHESRSSAWYFDIDNVPNAQKSIEGRADGAFAVCERFGDDNALDLLYNFRGQQSTFRIANGPKGIYLIGISTYYSTLRELIRFLESDSDILGVSLNTQPEPPRPSKAPQRAPVPPPEQFDSVDDNDHENQPWYLEDMAKEQALELIEYEPQGSFIVRDSSSEPGCYALSYSFGGRVQHKLIESTSSGVRIRQADMFFPNLSQLVNFYMNNPTNDLKCLLIAPRDRQTILQNRTRRLKELAAENQRNATLSRTATMGTGGTKAPWDCRALTRERAMDKLTGAPVGTFVIRASDKSFAALSMVSHNGLYHMHIESDSRGVFFRKCTEVFPNLVELVDFYSTSRQTDLPAPLLK